MLYYYVKCAKIDEYANVKNKKRKKRIPRNKTKNQELYSRKTIR